MAADMGGLKRLRRAAFPRDFTITIAISIAMTITHMYIYIYIYIYTYIYLYTHVRIICTQARSFPRDFLGFLGLDFGRL